MSADVKPSESSHEVFVTGVTEEDRERGEQVEVTGWSDGAVGIAVEYTEEQTRTTTYIAPDVARRIAEAILAAVPTPERPAVGTVFLDPATGMTYALTEYVTDWERLDETTREENDGLGPQRPSYIVTSPQGFSTRVEELAEGAFVIWEAR